MFKNIYLYILLALVFLVSVVVFGAGAIVIVGVLIVEGICLVPIALLALPFICLYWNDIKEWMSKDNDPDPGS